MKPHLFFSLLRFKTIANLRTEISRYYLNYLWWGLEPILTMTVFYVVFGIMLNRGTEHYVAFLLSGLVWWNWFARSIQNGANSIINSRALMLQVDIPKAFFPLEVCFRDAFKQLFATALLMLFLLFYPTPVSTTWLALPVIMAIQFIFIIGLTALCASIVPFIPDLQFVVRTGINLLFFGSGVFYHIDDVVLPEHHVYMYMNPIAGLLKSYRDILIYEAWPDWNYLLKVSIAGILLCVVSFSILKKFDRTYPWICNQ